MVALTELINFVSTVGFPIIVTLYLLTRFEKTIQGNTNAIKELNMIIKIKKKI